MALASRGLRDLDEGREAIGDAAELRQVRSQARVVHINALVLAAGLTVIALLIP